MKAERVVFDTNVLISALLIEAGKPFACLRWARANAAIVTSAPLLEELLTRLARPKFRKYRSMVEVAAFVELLATTNAMAAISNTVRAARDPADDMVLETAVTGLADVIVTGDDDLLVLDPFRGIRILAPSTFLSAVGAAEER
jgi:putative PIN family toxin of toxin-antitoxin system